MTPLAHNDDAPELTAAQALSLASRLRDRFAVMEGLPHPVVRVGYFPRHRRLLNRIKRHALDFAGLMLAGTALLIFAHFGGQS